ncbi:MAG: NAD(P)H-binding protein [Leeuwenhoekiella sp.]
MSEPSKVLLLGASGMLGLEVAKNLFKENIPFRALTSSKSGLAKLAPFTQDIWVADVVHNPNAIAGICKDIDSVISGMGKSISLFSTDDDTFNEVDNLANATVLLDAITNRVSYYIYVSIKEAGDNDEFEIPKNQKSFEDKLNGSGITNCIFRPVGFYSGLHDLAVMAKKGIIPVIGDGTAKTNSIAQEDFAKVIVKAYLERKTGIQIIGGPEIHSRYAMAEMIKARFGGKIVTVPETLADVGMVLPQFFDKSTYHKLKFFKFITTHDMLGDIHGNLTFREYLSFIDESDLP